MIMFEDLYSFPNLTVHEDVLKHLPVPLQNTSAVLELVQMSDIMVTDISPGNRISWMNLLVLSV